MNRDQREHLYKIISWRDFTELDQHKLLLYSPKPKSACYAETLFWNLYQVRFFFLNRKSAWKLATINTEIIKLDMVKKPKETPVTYFFVKGKIRYLKKRKEKEAIKKGMRS